MMARKADGVLKTNTQHALLKAKRQAKSLKVKFICSRIKDECRGNKMSR
jgi:hypothetical protein